MPIQTLPYLLQKRALRTCFFAITLFFSANAKLAANAPDTIPASVFVLRDTFCAYQFLLVNNHFYDPSNPTGTEILPGAAASGGDSIIQVELAFFSPVTYDLNQVICERDTIYVNNVPYHAKHYLGQEIIEGGASTGCDSVVNIRLSIVPEPFSNLTDTLCADGFLMINGVRYDKDNPSGLEILSNASFRGCDSLVFIALAFRTTYLYLGEDQEIAVGDTLCLNPVYGPTAQTLAWSPAPLCFNPDSCVNGCIRPFQNIDYQVVGTDVYGCTSTDELHIQVSKEQRIYAPNVFRPFDGQYPNNRFFLSAGLGVINIKRMQIVDRWGEPVFYRENFLPDLPEEGWDGIWHSKPMPPGVYLWWAEFESIDGKKFIRKGDLTIVR